MIYTSPQGTVYKHVHSHSGSVSIAVKADNNIMELCGFHNDVFFSKQPVLLGGNWMVVQNVHMLTQEEHVKLANALERYVQHNGRWTPPEGFGAGFANGCLIVWPKEYINFFSEPVQEYPKDTTGPTQGDTGKSDGSSADYYKLPQGCSQLQDLISHCDMNAQMGEIFRAAYRYGRASHSNKLRDAKKIKFYIEAEIKRLESQ